MQHVDALSRKDSILLVRDPFLEHIEKTQKHDEKLKAIRKLLEQGEYEDYALENGLVFVKKDNKRKLVVPKGMRNEVIKRAHEMGHFASRKTIEQIQQNYFFDNMEKHVKSYINNCLTCILASRKQRKAEVLNPIPKGETLLHTLHIDHVGKLPSTNKNYKHLFVVVDAFTKYTWVFATKSTSTGEVLEKLKILQQHFGSPYRIISDQGTAFTSHEFKEFCNKEGTT